MKRITKSGLSLGRSVILIDKPKGPTSFDVVEAVSKELSVKKAGHTGTLDPNATGLLVIALGEARKAMPVLTGLDKEYEGVLLLHGDADLKILKHALVRFKGEITQVPPVRSAVARKARKRVVHDIELLELKGRNVRFRVRCEAGTYIRKIAHDLGQHMGCGAHLVELRRTKVGPFHVKDSISMPELKRAGKGRAVRSMIRLEDALDAIKLPRIMIKDEYEEKIRNGSPIRSEFVNKAPVSLSAGDDAGVFDGSGRIICLAKYVNKAGTVATVSRVFLDQARS